MSALPFTLPDLDVHPDGKLLRALGRLTALHDEGDRLRRAHGSQARLRWFAANGSEVVRLDELVAATQAVTAEGLLAKAEHALRNVNPRRPDFGGLRGVALSALWDAVRLGRLA